MLGGGSALRQRRGRKRTSAAWRGLGAEPAAARPQVHIISAACENMIDGKGMRPGDILQAANGKTVEVRRMLGCPPRPGSRPAPPCPGCALGAALATLTGYGKLRV